MGHFPQVRRELQPELPRHRNGRSHRRNGMDEPTMTVEQPADPEDAAVEDLLVDDVSIDGMRGV